MTRSIMVTQNTFKFSLLALTLAAISSGCGIYETKNNALNRGNSLQRLDPLTKVSFATVAKNVFKADGNATCKGCHTDGGSKGGVTLDTYADVKRELSRIQGTVFDEVPRRMPTRAALSADQKQLLKQWIDQGAVETVNDQPSADPTPVATPEPTPAPTPDQTPAPTPDPVPTATPDPVATATPAPTAAPVVTPTPAPAGLVATYPSIRDNVFAAKCLSCHSASGRASDLPLDDYAAMMATNSLVIAGDLANSTIISEIEGGSMPPRRSGLPKVTADELAVIKLWITNGATP